MHELTANFRVEAWLATRFLLLMVSGTLALPAHGERVSDVRASRHNLSAAAAGTPTGGGRTVPARTLMATSESQVCVFCHTPHGATAGASPLWNRQLSATGTYTVYTSSSLDANVIQGSLDQPGGTSKLCLSCHDGTLAVGSVNVLNGAGSQTSPGTVSIPMTGTGAGGVMAPGAGVGSGFTRNLGVNLTNDHPISVSYTDALAARDAELRVVSSVATGQKWPGTSSSEVIGVRGSGQRHLMPLEATAAGGVGQVQCGTCHNPHLVETDASVGNQKFLRLNRFQEAQTGATSTATFTASGDIICVACHDKNASAGVWAFSAHANSNVATQTYTAAAAGLREFPAGLPVWKAACMNCHDTHTVQGARRLLREGTDSAASPKSGGEAALEETCYQCHSNDANTVITPLATVPDIKSDFALGRRMPVRSVDQPAGSEAHDIGGNFSDGQFVDCSGPANGCGKDFVEKREKLGNGNLGNRHAECTDCHNPHRVLKKRNGIPGSLAAAATTPDPAGTHPHTDTSGYTHTNIISGALRGSWGVEPIYTDSSFQSLPSSYMVKRGDPGNSIATDAAQSYVTREYQICLKCHSDYGYSDNNVYPNGNRPLLGSFSNGTPAGTNGLNTYTNQAKEFQAPAAHKGEVTTTDSGAAAGFAANNHRSWHPVMDATGRTTAIRNASAANWLLPWSNAVGTQTMYCSDCHGSNTGTTTSVIPNGGENGSPWGPHGSSNNFILKGSWDSQTGSSDRSPTAADIARNGLCFKCHAISRYADRNGGGTSGFGGGGDANMHALHADKIGRMRCTWCHVAIPHGWKNKSFLVNLNDVGPEAGLAAGTQVRNGTSTGYSAEPYYLNAMLKVRTFKTSGNWQESDCGSSGAPGNGQSGRDWMRDSSENCANPP